MQLTMLGDRARLLSPPSLVKIDTKVNVPVNQDLDKASVGTKEKQTFSHALGAMAALALSFGPQVAKASELKTSVHSLLSSTDALDPTCDCPEKKDCCPTEQDSTSTKPEEKTWNPLKGDVLPPSWTETRNAELAKGWNLSVEPIDVDVRPKWKDGPALQIKGDFLKSSLQKTEALGEQWMTTKGLRGNIRGELRSYDKPLLDLEVQAFQEWRGPLTETLEAKFSASVGLRSRFLGKDEDVGLGAGLSLRQEVQGAPFHMLGTDYTWYMEGRQNVFHNLTSGETKADYRLMVGPKRDVNISLFGKKAKITIAAGPEFKGRSGEAFSVGAKAKIKVKF